MDGERQYILKDLLERYSIGREEWKALKQEADAGSCAAIERMQDELVCLGAHIMKQYAEKQKLDFHVLAKYIDVLEFAQIQKYFLNYDLCVQEMLERMQTVEHKAYICIRNGEDSIKVPSLYYEEVCKSRKKLWNKLQREPSEEEIYMDCRIVTEKKLGKQVTSKEISAIVMNEQIEERIREASIQHKKELKEQVEKSLYVQGYNESEVNEILFRLDEMTIREAMVYTLRLGYFDGKERRIEEIEEICGLSAISVQRILKKYVPRVRKKGITRNKRLIDYLDEN